ncbi:MAG TPA: bifunctional DNA-formamidopyrimidine glycosylase/DNA-(apurinic or apyrimidinic site) lyase [Thermomicrobiaceae bacterium]|nr:bifunctional DNA-formamidopyrimidine glycosylase/DNA-(apurinic or apyrimidinic site) lyase [Thermomicrobiaceae bacterium]
MPELPEVEAARRGIAEQLVGRRVTGHQLWLPKLIVAEDGLTLDQLTGTRLEDVERHGKYLLLRFAPFSAVVHLKLAGQLVARGGGIPGFAAGHPVPAYDAPLPHKSTHLRLDFDGDAQLYLTDLRHFGRVWLLPHAAVPDYLAGLKLGPDILAPDFSLKLLRRRLARRGNSRLKPALLDQAVVAGLGNIYVDESLWQAKLHPERLVGSLSDAETKRLYQGIQRTMGYAVPIGGARILHTKAQPEPGEFPFVHGREGLPCPRCGGTIVKTRVNTRGTYRCPRCQPQPR